MRLTFTSTMVIFSCSSESSFYLSHTVLRVAFTATAAAAQIAHPQILYLRSCRDKDSALFPEGADVCLPAAPGTVLAPELTHRLCLPPVHAATPVPSLNWLSAC